ncbi:MAG TPA: PHP domain-containing protein, partial [Chitinophagaceae bacterium]|nr:PHP domain-containing protein [Chitinophagaceae bacterium]
MKFSHLHNHTQFSLLDGASSIKRLFQKAVKDQMPAMAITDHGNMFGVFDFVKQAKNFTDEKGIPLVKPIVGCEFYIVENRHKQQFTKEQKDVRYHQLLLAKNSTGYKNLIKLCSLGYIEGLYGKYPRIDKELILQYHEGLIASTCCLGASVPRTILKDGVEAGEEEFKWWLNIFGEDYYVELQRHGIPDQDKVNLELVRLARKYNVKIIASNDSHYVDEADSNAHDILLCINTGELQSTPKMKEFADDDAQVKNKRFAFYNNQFFFKNSSEMIEVFSDLPEAIDHTNEIAGKVELVSVTNDLLLPNFPLPAPFTDQDSYLEFLTMEGAKARYTVFTPELDERLKFELG